LLESRGVGRAATIAEPASMLDLLRINLALSG
jgi:hypothetical protein